MKVFFRFFKLYPKESILAPLFKLLEACFDLLVPLVVAVIVDQGVGEGNRSLIIQMSLVLVLLAVVGLSCALCAQYFAAKSAIGTAARLRHELFAHMQAFTYAQTDCVGTSTMITRMTSDINQVQSGINMTLRLFLRSPIIVLGAMLMAFTIHTRLALIFVVAIPLLSVVVFGVMLGGIPLFKRVQSRLDHVTAVTRENLAGVRVIRAFCKEEEEIEAFDRANKEQTSLQNKAGILSSLMNPLTYVIVNFAVILLIRQGSVSVNIGGLTQGELVALVNYMGQILVELVKLASTIFLVTKAVACGNRIGAVLNMPSGTDVLAAEAAEPGSAAVTFENVTLAYHRGSHPSLENIEFSVQRGQTVGIIGGTGSGKSSLVNLIPRFYDATEGRVLVNGRDVRSYEPQDLRRLIGVVPQKAELFRGSIRSNLCWGKANATDEELWCALELAQAADFVREKEGMLDAPVEQKGRNFSGGQKQRLTIARALVGAPEILILDDSASALDFVTDARLRGALRTLEHQPTVFVISQRTSSIRHADLIVVLEDGRVVGMGQHKELLDICETYREIHMSQFKGGEEA
ncbi:MAG: ABC transporter ATP-binding protein [Ruminococcaceae bacterium]|nr:ABC transporter ATP-binding protein [Oscillospiraceae bacterium]